MSGFLLSWISKENTVTGFLKSEPVVKGIKYKIIINGGKTNNVL